MSDNNLKGSISIRGVSKVYDPGGVNVMAVDNCSLEIAAGEVCMIVGPSGCGKTTLLNAIGGLDMPDSGEVWIGDTRIDQLNKGELAELRLRNIGFVFQAYNLIPVLTARENVEFVMEVRGVPSVERQKKIPRNPPGSWTRRFGGAASS